MFLRLEECKKKKTGKNGNYAVVDLVSYQIKVCMVDKL